MKKYLLLSFVTLQCALLNAQIKNDQQPFLTKPLKGESVSNVKVETSGGSISVTGVNDAESRIEVYVSPNNSKNKLSDAEIKKRIDEDYELNISVSNNRVTAIARPKDRSMNWKKALNISFKVFVPKNVSTELGTSGGSIHLADIRGTQDFTTSGGSLHVENVSGKILGKTSGGSIHLQGANDDINLSTSGGSIEANHCHGDMKLATSGGSLRLQDLQGSVNASTSGGSVHANNIHGELYAHTSGGNVFLKDLYCSLETSTSGGNIDVAITELGKFVRIDNSSGNVDLQIPKNSAVNLRLRADKIKTGTLNNFQGTAEEDNIIGKLNGGGIPVTVNAGSGRIQLAFKD